MKKIFLFLLVFGVSMGILTAQEITVNSPAAGVTWEKGQSKSITWAKSGTMDPNVKITLRNPDDSLHSVITMSTPNDGNYPWVIPASIPDGSYMIRVKTTDNQVWDNSGAFTIATGSSIPEFKPVGTLQAHLIKTPDLKVTITPTPVSPGAGQKIVVAFKTTNIGEGKSKDTVMKAFAGQHLKGSWNVGELQPGDHYTKTVEVTPDGPGYYLWSARVDENNNIGDSKRANNYAKLKQIVKGPDLVVAFDGGIRSIITTTATVKGYVRNNGQSKSAPCKLKIYMEKKGVKKYNVPALNPGEIFEVARGEKYYIAQTITVNMMIDVDGVVKEENEKNNFVQENIKIVVSGPYYASNFYCSNGKDGHPLESVW